MDTPKSKAVSRRAVVAAMAGVALGPHRASRKDRIRIGVIGCGQRGSWIASLFAQHGGYEVYAVADYFKEAADRCGDALGVDAKRRFHGLNGYLKLMDAGIAAVALETPPYCFPDHAAAAVHAGLHVYMAKPVAVDVPGCLRIRAAAAEASAKGRVFLVDYQMPTDPGNIRVVEQIHKGAIGKVIALQSYYLAGGWPDPPRNRTIEDRLQHLIWVNDVALGGGHHVNACIHAIDAALWAAGSVPVAAVGASRIGRADPHGDSHDLFSLTYEFADGLILNHRAKHLNDAYPSGDFCGCWIHGQSGCGWISYAAKAQMVNASDAFSVDVADLYAAGARRNIAAFHEAITKGDCSNPTVRHAVESALTTIMGREAARRRRRITMEALMKENQRIAADLRGLEP
ncbi:MAG: Gfo/Idh/MocA family protein [Chthonomonadales bacterium]